MLAWYACARLGAVGVTTNNRSVANEINYFATHTGCVGAITQPQYAALVAEAAPELKWIVVTADNSGVPATDDELAHGNESFESLFGSASSVPERPAEPMLPAGIVFTSGTTSRPKAVVHTHANVLWAGQVGPDNIELDADNVYLASLPFFHVNTQSWAIWSVLGVGGTVVLQPKFSTSRFWEVVAKHGVTHISLLPFVIQSIMNDKPEEHTVKIGVFGLIMPVLDEMLGMRVVAAYGMTETVIHAIHGNRFEKYPDMSMGKPTPGYEAIVVDPDTGEVVHRWPQRRALDPRHPRDPAVPRVLRQPRGQREGVHRRRLAPDRRHRPHGRRRQLLLLRSRQGRPQGRRRERVGP